MQTETQTEPQKRSNRHGGRPKMQPFERRCYGVKIAFNEADWQKFEARAANAGLHEAEYLRRIANNVEIRTYPAINREALLELGKIGTNINQIAKVANSTGSTTHLEELKKLSEQIKNLGAAIVSQR